MPYSDPEKARQKHNELARARYHRLCATDPEGIARKRAKSRESRKRFFAANPDKKREYEKRRYQKYGSRVTPDMGRKIRYGLSPEDFQTMRTAQKNACAVCEKPFVSERKIYVDHDHCTGKVRGLPCPACNVGIGHLEKPDFIRRGLLYLERTRNA